MQDSASSREHGAIGGSISGVEQKYAFRKLALGLVVSPEESSTSPFIVSEDGPELDLISALFPCSGGSTYKIQA